MKKAFRDIKRGVNKKVLKVPSIEQKVLDATSNEPWGPHGTHLADIAQASRNYHEYQMIMSIVWKRLNDTGKNWRHVFKGLTILEYLVANGSERVIDDIREHAYQITALSSFQYIDSTGRDQGSNIRKKSQLLVALVNDKEKIQEVREKAAGSRERFRNGSGEDRNEGHYGNREEDRNGYGREREWGGDDEYRGRSTSNDGDYGPRSQSSDRERSFEDDGHRSSRESNARVEDASPDASRVEAKSPPRYEDAVTVSDGHSPTTVDTNRDGETAAAFSSSPQVTINHQETPVAAPPPAATATPPPPPPPPTNNENDGFDFFDPRAFAAPAPAQVAASGGGEMDLLGSLSDSFSSNSLALVPSTSVTTQVPPPPPTTANTNPYLSFDTPSPAVPTQAFDDPFGDGPFRAVPSTEGFSATSPFGTSDQTLGNDLGFGDAFDPSVDILADILPPPGPPQTATAFQSQPQPPASSVIPTTTENGGQPPPAEANPFGLPPPATFSSQPMPQPHPPPPQSMPDFPPQSMQQSAFEQLVGGVPQSQPGLQVQGGGQQSMMPQSAFQQFPNGQQQQPSIPQSAFPGGHQSMPQQQSPFQVSGGQQPTPPLSAYQLPGGQPPITQSAYQAPRGLPQSALQVQGGHHQSIPQPSFPAQSVQSMMQPPSGFAPQNGSLSSGFPSSNGNANGNSIPPTGFPAQSVLQQNGNMGLMQQQPSFLSQGGAQNGFHSNGQPGFTNSNGQPNNLFGGFQPQASSAPVPPLSQPTPTPHYNNPSNFYQQQQQQQPSLTASTGTLALVPPQAPADKKFETKSTVWADTLNRGLVNLNISGAKTNPLSDIGIDFDAINRKEKRQEKPTQKPTVTSTVTMGKAMGSGSGMGRAGAGVLRPAPNPMVAPGMAAPAGYQMNINMNMGGQGYQMQPQPQPQPMGMNQNMGMGMGMNMNMGGQGFPPGGYNPMMGRGAAYGIGQQQQPYGGAYR